MNKIIPDSHLKTFLNHLYDNEYVEFMTTMVKHLEADAENVPTTAPVFDTLKNLSHQEDLIFKKTLFTDLTEDLRLNDKKRDASFKACRRLLDNARYSSDPVQQEAARRLDPVFKNYKQITSADYQGESSLITNFVVEMRKLQNATYVNAVGLKDKIDEMEKENDDFISLYYKRTKLEEAQKEVGSMRSIRKELNEAFVAMVAVINSSCNSSIINKDNAFMSRLKKMAELINGFISTYTTTLARRGVHLGKGSGGSSGDGDDIIIIDPNDPGDGDNSEGGGNTPPDQPHIEE